MSSPSEGTPVLMEGNPGPRKSSCSDDKHASAIVPSEGKTNTLGDRGHKTIGKWLTDISTRSKPSLLVTSEFGSSKFSLGVRGVRGISSSLGLNFDQPSSSDAKFSPRMLASDRPKTLGRDKLFFSISHFLTSSS